MCNDTDFTCAPMLRDDHITVVPMPRVTTPTRIPSPTAPRRRGFISLAKTFASKLLLALLGCFSSFCFNSSTFYYGGVVAISLPMFLVLRNKTAFTAKRCSQDWAKLTVRKKVAVGGEGGDSFDDMDAISSKVGSSIVRVSRMELVANRYDGIVFTPTYLLESGDEVSISHGLDGISLFNKFYVIDFDDSARLTKVEFRKDDIKLYWVTFWDSNGQKYGPFGNSKKGKFYSFAAEGPCQQVIAFHGKSGDSVDCFGAYIR